MQIVFVRHGETDENAAQTYLGHTDASLNDHGRDQIERLTPQLVGEWDTFYSSDLKRCRETASIIAKNLNLKQTPTLVPALRELNFGAWECRTYEQIMADDHVQVTAWIDNPFEMAPPNGETLVQLGVRFDEWFEQLLQQAHLDEKIMIVCHGGPIRWFKSKWLLGDPKQFWYIDGIKHGHGLLVHYDKNGKQFTEVKYI